jgi:hypothetical protein
VSSLQDARAASLCSSQSANPPASLHLEEHDEGNGNASAILTELANDRSRRIEQTRNVCAGAASPRGGPVLVAFEQRSGGRLSRAAAPARQVEHSA